MRKGKSLMWRVEKDDCNCAEVMNEYPAAASLSLSNTNRAAAPSPSTDEHPASYSLYLDTFNTAFSYH